MKEKHRILIIDDDEGVLRSFKLWLQNEGFIVFTAPGREKALQVIRRNKIDVALVDLKLKEDNGLAISQELRGLDEQIRIIMITGYPTYETAIDAMKSGISDYISKSSDNETILGRIRSVIREREAQMLDKKQDISRLRNLALVCHHLLIKEGLDTFCKDHAEYNVLQSFHSFAYIKKSDFSQNVSLVLLCAECNAAWFDKPEEIFPFLKLYFPNGRIIVINSSFDDDRKGELLRRGVKGFFPENINKSTLKKALDAVYDGQIWISRELTNKLLSALLEDTGEIVYSKPANIYDLSNREIELLQAMASGLSNYEISEKLFISEKTVKTHINNIFKKMGVNSRTQAVIKALEQHII